MSTPFRAVILAGGRGTRLRPYTVTLPKPLVPVGDEPILDIVMRQLKAAGVERVTLAVSHLAELLMAYFGEGARLGLPIDYSREPQPLGTVGPLRLIPDLPSTFLVMNGDILTDLDFRGFWERHNASGAIASVGTVDRTTTLDYGVMHVGADGVLTAFQEKPTLTHSVSMGVYAFSREVLRFVPADQPFGFDNLMLTLLAHGERVRCEPHAGRWLDIGRPDDYEAAQRLSLDGRLPSPA